MTEIEIGRGKRGRRAYAFDDIAVVPSRRTRDPKEVSIAWQIDAYRFELPFLAAPMDSVVSPETAIRIGELGGLGVLNLEGLWTRYDDPQALLEEIAELDRRDRTRLQEIYSAPIQEELIGQRIKEVRDSGVVTAAALSPQRTAQFSKAVVDAGVDIFVIRGTTVSAEHVSGAAEPLNLKQFIYELDVPVIVGGCATYTAALHLMRTGAAGVLVGFGGGAAHTTRNVWASRCRWRPRWPMWPAARRDYMDESGGRYVHVIADGGFGVRRPAEGDRVRRGRGDDGLPAGPRHGRARPRLPLGHGGGPRGLPRGKRMNLGTAGTTEEILLGPSHAPDGSMNFFGALRRSMATTATATSRSSSGSRSRSRLAAPPLSSPATRGRARTAWAVRALVACVRRVSRRAWRHEGGHGPRSEEEES